MRFLRTFPRVFLRELLRKIISEYFGVIFVEFVGRSLWIFQKALFVFMEIYLRILWENRWVIPQGISEGFFRKILLYVLQVIPRKKISRSLLASSFETSFGKFLWTFFFGDFVGIFLSNTSANFYKTFTRKPSVNSSRNSTGLGNPSGTLS